MQSDTRTMIELQRLWDKVIHGRSEIKAAKAAIAVEGKAASAARSACELCKKDLIAAKLIQKQKEIELLDRETLLPKLADRKFNVQNNRELKAVEAEIDRAETEKGLLEEELLRLMDEIVERESSCSAIEKDAADKEKDAAEKSVLMKERLLRFDNIVVENEARFNAGLSALSSQVRSRYSKMVTSVDGKGIVPIDGDNCGGCHFSIPFDIRRESVRTDLVLICPHCGKYIFAPDVWSSLSS